MKNGIEKTMGTKSLASPDRTQLRKIGLSNRDALVAQTRAVFHSAPVPMSFNILKQRGRFFAHDFRGLLAD